MKKEGKVRFCSYFTWLFINELKERHHICHRCGVFPHIIPN